MVFLKVPFCFGAALFAAFQPQSFVSAQGLNRLTNGFIVEFTNAPDELNRVRAQSLDPLPFLFSGFKLL